MTKYYSDKSLTLSNLKTYNPKTKSFEEDAPTNSTGAGNNNIGVGPDIEPIYQKKEKEKSLRWSKKRSKHFSIE